MIKIKKVDVYGWEAAIRSMRNPMNSWDKSDSFWKIDDSNYEYEEYYVDGCGFVIMPNDLKLMRNLAKAGDDHGKFLRMINVTCDITAPLYWWKEFDTYKVGTVANSCSTMHCIHKKEFTLDDFSCEHLVKDWVGDNCESMYYWECKSLKEELFASPLDGLKVIIGILNVNREAFLRTKDKKYWWQMIQLLPSSYNQMRTVQLNYQVLKNMYHARKLHKLDCWRDFCTWMKNDLPYFKEICLIGGVTDNER